MVYLHHFNPFAGTTDHKKLLYFFTEFNVGVTLFFVLSGFLIAHRYYDLPKLD
ncbi:MAG: acyltransferase family protein, partial [Bacteroidia bacterium]